MKPVLDESVIGRIHFWMKVSLDEIVHCVGGKCFWRKVFLGKMFLDDFFFSNLDESVPNRPQDADAAGRSR